MNPFLSFFLSVLILLAQKDTLSIIAVGDLMISTHYPNESYLASSQEIKKAKELFPLLNSADLSFANFEGVLLDEGKARKQCQDSTKCYLFKTPTRYAKLFKEAGFDLMSLANNHSGDFGERGRDSTIHYLEKNDIYLSGLKRKAYTVFEKAGRSFAFISFSPNDGTLSINNHKEAKKLVQKLDPLVDILILSFHGGAEGKKYQRLPKKREYFYGEDRGDVYQFAHDMVDAGADLILGHGPHVSRAIEIYKNRFISYSLGNFWTYGRFNLSAENGYAPLFKLYLRDNGSFIKGRLYSIQQIGRGIPVLDSQKKALKKIISLSNLDFPKHQIQFDDDLFYITKLGR